mgnify:CR=1 FL=1
MANEAVAQQPSTASQPLSSIWNGGRLPFGSTYGKLMMWFFLLSDAFTFSALLTSYGFIRVTAYEWVDPEQVFQGIPPFINHGLPLVFVGIMTFILIVSSVTMVLAVEAGHHMQQKEVEKYMLYTILGGLAFLGCQALEWQHLIHEGLSLTHNPFDHYDVTDRNGSVMFGQLFYIITGFHGTHVLSGVIINIIIYFNVRRGVYQKRGHYEMVEKVGLYWHFVDLVWVFVFTLFYLI